MVLFILSFSRSHTVIYSRFLKTEGRANEVLNACRAHHQLVDVRKNHGSTRRVVVQAGPAHEAFASVAFFVFVILIRVKKLFAAKETPLLPRSWRFFGKLHRRGQVSSAFFEKVVVPLLLLHGSMCSLAAASLYQRFSVCFYDIVFWIFFFFLRTTNGGTALNQEVSIPGFYGPYLS